MNHHDHEPLNAKTRIRTFIVVLSFLAISNGLVFSGSSLNQPPSIDSILSDDLPNIGSIENAPRETSTFAFGSQRVRLTSYSTVRQFQFLPIESYIDDAKKIYLDKCARCHGDQGQGIEELTEPLHGDLPVDDLAEYIHATMPEDDPDRCVDEEATLVAEYIHQQFYSPQARPSREKIDVSFSRLTTRQFKESAADLVGFFDQVPWHLPQHGLERGLKAFYFASRHRDDKRKLAEQIDKIIDFNEQVPHFDPTGEYAHLGEKPKAENQMGEGFSVYWNGSVLAPQTGWYDIKVQSKNGFQLYLNSQREPLIDRKVRSDDVNDHEARIFLQAGRAYRLKLDFFSYPDPPAKIRLLWTPPIGVEEVIPHQNLLPQDVPESMSVTIAFPADDASSGYERGISISQEWDEAVTSSAIEVADWIGDRLWRYAQTDEQAEDRLEKVKSFCRKFVQLAFVKPLNEMELQFFVNQHFDNELSLKDQVKRVVILTLKSPRFLYPELEQRDPNFLIARRLALVVWDSVPDRELVELSEQSKLADPATIERQLQRMLQDPRSKAKLHSFFRDWLSIENKISVSKDPQQFLGFNEQILFDSRRSLELFIERLISSEQADARQLFSADYLLANRRMAEFYGFPWPATASDKESSETATPTEKKDTDKSAIATLSVLDMNEFVEVVPNYGIQSGIITHPYLLTGLAYYQHSSPIHRGVFVARRLLGRTLKQPNENFEPLAEDFDPSLNTRQRVEFQTKDSNCMSCHSIINPLGFSLENFDAVGRYRTTEKDKPIDTKSVYKTPVGESVILNGPRDLANLLANHEAAQRNFTKQLFQQYTRQPVQAFGSDTPEQLYREFVTRDYNIRQLVVAVARVTIADQLKTELTEPAER